VVLTKKALGWDPDAQFHVPDEALARFRKAVAKGESLEGEWNEKLRILANAREERERAREHDQFILDEAVHERLIAMTADFHKLWADPDTPNRERKRLLAHIIEDVTLVKLPAEGTTKVHVRFKGGKIQTLTTLSPKSSAQQVKTQPGVVESHARHSPTAWTGGRALG